MGSAQSQIDGRRQRREAGRNRVIDAAIALVLEGHGLPTSDAVIERSGISSATLFRYFESLDDLRRAFLSRYFERIDAMIAIDNVGSGSFTQRLNKLCNSRLAFFVEHAPMAMIGRTRAQEIPEIFDAVQRFRATLSEQVSLQFDEELSQLKPVQRRYCESSLSTLTSFESWSALRAEGQSEEQILQTWKFGITRLLSA